MMKSKDKISLIIFTALTVILIFEFLFFYFQVPERLAIHFTLANQPNGWMNKTPFYFFSAFIYLITAGLMAGFYFILPKINEDFINVPNRRILLNENNKEITYSIISRFLIYSANLTLVLLIILYYSLFHYNINKENFLISYIFEIVAVYIIILLLMMYKSLKRIK